jgi:hypothetical protein
MIDPIQKLNDDTSLALHHQNAIGFAFPPIIPLKTVVRVPSIDKDGKTVDSSLQNAVDAGLKSLGSTYWQVPITLKLDTESNGFKLPLDPLVSLSGKNVIIRRYVSKSEKRGSIKERWSQDDYEITITGVLTTDDTYDVKDYVKALLKYCEAKNAVDVKCDLLNNVFLINKIAIESYDFPFTKGIENQAFTIKGYSDDVYELLIELKPE